MGKLQPLSPEKSSIIAGLVAILAVAGLGAYFYYMVTSIAKPTPTRTPYGSAIISTELQGGGVYLKTVNLKSSVPTVSSDSAAPTNAADLGKQDLTQYE